MLSLGTIGKHQLYTSMNVKPMVLLHGVFTSSTSWPSMSSDSSISTDDGLCSHDQILHIINETLVYILLHCHDVVVMLGRLARRTAAIVQTVI